MLIKYLVGSILLILFGFIVFRILVRREYAKRSKLSPLVYLLEVIVFAGHIHLIYLFLPVKWPNMPPWPENGIIKLLTAVLFLAGVIILAIAWFGLGTGPSFGQDKGQLNTRGIYRLTRNPQLVGYGIMLLSFTILWFSWYSMGWIVQYLMIAYFMIRSEEEFLEAQYGEAYKKYCSEVPRILKLY